MLFLTRFVTRPLHLFGGTGLLIGSVGVAITAWLGFRRVFFQEYLSNRPLLFAGLLLTIVGVQLVSVGLVGEMIAAVAVAGHRPRVFSVRREIGPGSEGTD